MASQPANAASARSLALAIALLGCADEPSGSGESSSESGGTTTGSTSAVDATTSSTSGSASDGGTESSSTQAETTGTPPGDAGSLRFFGQGGTYDDRVLVRVDEPRNAEPGPPIDVGAEDFTIELWIRPDPAANANPAIACGNTNAWVESNIVVDRDRHSQPPSYGIGIAGGVIVWAVQGVSGDPWSMCGGTDVLDDAWHHVAAQRRRSDGWLWLYVDGQLDAEVDGPDGDVSYPDDGMPMEVCPAGACDYSDPFLSIGAEKHGYGGISYAGWVDELRVSTTLRYEGDSFSIPSTPFDVDADTAALYHFDDGEGTRATDASANATHGELQYGGDPPGPEWSSESPF